MAFLNSKAGVSVCMVLNGGNCAEVIVVRNPIDVQGGPLFHPSCWLPVAQQKSL